MIRYATTKAPAHHRRFLHAFSPACAATFTSPLPRRRRGDLTFHTSIDHYGNRRYCSLYEESIPSPTLRLHPGDELVLRLRNALPESGDLSAPSNRVWPHAHSMELRGMCGGGKLYAASTNLHFHGIHALPACHQDDVLTTLGEPDGGWYEYRMRIPATQAGLFGEMHPGSGGD